MEERHRFLMAGAAALCFTASGAYAQSTPNLSTRGEIGRVAPIQTGGAECCDGSELDEGEPCGDDTNGGCNSTPNVYTPAACGDVFCGTGWADGGTRDTDWYLVSHPGGVLSGTLESQFDGVVFVVDGIASCAPAVVGVTGASVGCAPGTASADIPAGDYVIFVAAGVFEGFPCGSGANQYRLTIGCDGGQGPACGPDAGPCGEPNGTPGCDDVECCELICGLDAFCCETEWDQILANAALEQCGGGGDSNDLCEDRFEIFDGATDYTTIGADTDGLAHADCQFDGQTYQDVWYNYVATCTGTLTVTTCDSADYDTDLVVYGGCDVCPPGDGELLGCNDDDAACTGFTSTVIIDAIEGECYKIRVGGWNVGDEGNGTLTITCEGVQGPACGPDAGPCGEPNGTPGCDDVECCELVCAADSFCCETEWDQICVNLALELCEGGGLPNDQCENRIEIGDGATDYTTIGADTDGLAHAACMFDGQTYQDVWYNYTATCTGTLTVSTCGTADYDTDLVVYSGCDVCPPGDDDLLGCNDDGEDFAGFTSEVIVDVVEGECYKIRVGGWNAGDEGNGTLTITCDGGQEPVCGPGNGSCSEPNGTPGCEDVECCELICGQDPFCCDTEWDQICADAANEQCVAAECDCEGDFDGDGDVGPADLATLCADWNTPGETFPNGCSTDIDGDGNVGPFDLASLLANWGLCNPLECGSEAAGSCFEPNGSPYCADAECCKTVCSIDPFCCDVEWDELCAGEAEQFCGPPQEGCCDGSELAEGEECGTDTNGGCNSTPNAFTSAACGDVFCGNAWADGGTRDTDWYLVSHPGGTLSGTLSSEFTSVVFIVDGIGTCAPAVVGTTGASGGCVPGTASADLPAGEYVVFVAADVFEGFPCGGTNSYRLEINCN